MRLSMSTLLSSEAETDGADNNFESTDVLPRPSGKKMKLAIYTYNIASY